MSAAIVRRAADQIRRDQEREENLGHIDGRTYATWLAVADWLDATADDWQHANHTVRALRVALAYLGESA
jgi:hypothetical protein